MSFLSMKYISILLISLITFGMLGCQEELPPIGEPFDKLVGINASFKLIGVTQVDERTKIPDNAQLDISGFFIKNDPPVISFDANAMTYTYTPGDSPNFLGESGSWKFTNDEFPAQANEFPENIVLTNNGEDLTLVLQKTIREIETTLEFKLVKECDDTPAVSYIYIFERL